MDIHINWLIFFILFSHVIEKDMVAGDDPDCPRLQCDPKTILCRYRSFYADIATRKICGGCNVCIKHGSPVDSEGCPQLPCPKTLPPGACYSPWFYNSWINYNGKRCLTCEARLCNISV